MNAPLNELLKQTSRSFYRTLRVLPRAVRPQISLAYLLARTTDTIADTELVPLEQRLHALQKLRERIRGDNDTRLEFGELARQQISTAEGALLKKVETSLALLQALAPDDLRRVREVLEIITSGQELDLRRFAGASGEKTIALQTDAELDDYTYRVAGCVGEFWTKMCRAHLFREAQLDETRLLADSVRFGKGLQLVNILRDLPVDLQKARCYLPADGLAGIGLSPEDLLQPTNESRLRPFYNTWLDRAEGHLAAGWAYTNALPRGQVRVRLACAWPILIGVETIKLLRVANVLDPSRRIKISRAAVRKLFARSVVFYVWPVAWNRLFPTASSAQGKAVASDANFK
jgi:farnesyl-diphosphate farnesyltransferase